LLTVSRSSDSVIILVYLGELINRVHAWIGRMKTGILDLPDRAQKIFSFNKYGFRMAFYVGARI